MSKNNGSSQMGPSAPPSFNELGYRASRGPPPPSYDECMKVNEIAATAPVHQYTNFNPTPYQQQQAFQPLPPQVPVQGINCSGVLPSTSYGYVNPYQAHVQQQQSYLNSAPSLPSQSTQAKQSENVLYLAKGAKVKTTATGAISIPPPPPGCAPTPGQLAAMSGQPVMIKKQKKSFF